MYHFEHLRRALAIHKLIIVVTVLTIVIHPNRAMGQEVLGPHAWQGIHFGESFEEVKAKVQALLSAGVVRDDPYLGLQTLRWLSTTFAGVEFDVNFYFVGDRLHEIWFIGPYATELAAKADFDILYDIQRTAHGSPTYSDPYYSVHPPAGRIRYPAMWQRGPVNYHVGKGLNESGTMYFAQLVLEWTEIHQSDIRDAADGF